MSEPRHRPDAIDPDHPEWTEEDFRQALPALEALPPGLLKKLGLRGPQKAPTKVLVTLRLSREVLDGFRSTGTGWQTRIDRALKDWLLTHA